MTEISDKQLEANRENAKLGGVKTEEGKAVSRLNAIKHSILSNILTDEEAKDAVVIQTRLTQELDQSALYGALNRIQSLGLELVSLTRLADGAR